MINFILQEIGHCFEVQNPSTLLGDRVYVFQRFFKVNG
jgi:hypothetical protein